MIDQAVTTCSVSARYQSLRNQLAVHPLYSAIANQQNLRLFMQHHVFAVWDFMSLIKAMQMHIAPVRIPWLPPQHARYANLINQLVLEEESDHALIEADGISHASHFESYCQAMIEAGADVQPVTQFIEAVRAEGLAVAMQSVNIPLPAKKFIAFTFDIIGRNQLHLLAATLAYGRESLVPQLFKTLGEVVQPGSCNAPILLAYLERHIQLDQQAHAPMTIMMVQAFCEGSETKQKEAMQVAEQALVARLDFWDAIHAALCAQSG